MKLDIIKLAKLANLSLTDEESKKFSSQLTEVLKYIKKLNKITAKTSVTKNSYHALKNCTRYDENKVSFSQEESLSNNRVNINGYFKTKRIL